MRVSNQKKAAPLLVAAALIAALASGQGCANKTPPQGPSAAAASGSSPSQAPGEPGAASPGGDAAAGQVKPAGRVRQVGPRISTYYLSAGDEIRISVYGYGELERTVRIPPDGHIFFPMVGDINVDGMSIPELRVLIAERLKTAEEQKIASGDQILVRVYRQDDLTVATTVPSSGRVNLPLVGEVEIAGLTVEAANETIAEKLVRYVVVPSVSTTIQRSVSGVPGRIADPHVSIEVLVFGGHKILVLGEVERPGVYVSEGGSRVLEIVARAGGPTDRAKLKSVALVRPATETSAPLRALINLERALKEGDVTQNPPVQRGDVIYVPESTFASVARFFGYVAEIVRPFVMIETGIWLGQNIEAGPRDRSTTPAVVFQ